MKLASHMGAKRGFTLIELLVVIAIIGILSSVVLASLNTARSRGADAKIQSELRSLSVNAELYYDSSGNYGPTANSCTASGSMFQSTSPSNIQQIITSLTSSPGAAPSCQSNGTAYAVSKPLSVSGVHFCVDSTGKAATSSDAVTGTTCP